MKCHHCGRPIFKVVTTEREGTSQPSEYWTHKSHGMYFTDCDLHAEPAGSSVVVEAPPALTRRELEDFKGRVANAADAVAESIVAERSAGRKV